MFCFFCHNVDLIVNLLERCLLVLKLIIITVALNVSLGLAELLLSFFKFFFHFGMEAFFEKPSLDIVLSFCFLGDVALEDTVHS